MAPVPPSPLLCSSRPGARVVDSSATGAPLDDGSAQRDYHAASQRSLANALAIIQQAQELGLKSRIAAVSPYLLIAGDPRGWPKNSAGDLSFSEFRTIDASDLIRVHNTVCSTGVDDRFVQVFEDTRRRRNLIVHLGRHRVRSKVMHSRCGLSRYGWFRSHRLLEISLRACYCDDCRRETAREFQGPPQELPITLRR
jgi:hypothetical protein